MTVEVSETYRYELRACGCSQRLAWGLIGMRDFRHETVLEGSET
jgi:hypothetical protein